MVTETPFSKVFGSFFLTGIFCIAMGVLEAVVVVYLRQIYYPDGFDFPLRFMSPGMMQTEWIREIATIVMLVVLGCLVGKDTILRFLYFVFGFAIWDITYYIALYLFLDWPANLLSWDILFLIPIPWIGPVLAPLICSVTMLFMSLSFVCLKTVFPAFKIKLFEWGLILLGATLIYVSFTLDFFKLMMQFGYDVYGNEFLAAAAGFVPTNFYWILFGVGEAVILAGILTVIFRTRKHSSLFVK